MGHCYWGKVAAAVGWLFCIKAMGAELTAEANVDMNDFCSENEACECE